MTNIQIDICNYLSSEFIGCRYELLGKDRVKVIGKGGEEYTFTCNIFGDILDVKTKEVVAISDLPHDLDLIGNQRPSSWKGKNESFKGMAPGREQDQD